MQGLGTELGLFNMVLYAVTAAIVAMFAKRIKLLLTHNWEKHLKRHNKMWADYMKEKLEQASTDDFTELNGED